MEKHKFDTIGRSRNGKPGSPSVLVTPQPTRSSDRSPTRTERSLRRVLDLLLQRLPPREVPTSGGARRLASQGWLGAEEEPRGRTVGCVNRCGQATCHLNLKKNVDFWKLMVQLLHSSPGDGETSMFWRFHLTSDSHLRKAATCGPVL